MAVNFQDEDKSGTEKVARNPNNFNILKGGKVDPRSKLYQRSVAGRQTLEEFVKQEWNQGKDEKDVFMSAVRSLMNRGHGYVGAYLDSKDPGRRYTQNQAMKIADEVMKNAGVGEHPGARLTSAKSDEEKASRKEGRESRKASAPEAEPARGAMPVGQQRKLGKRESTGQPLEDSRREGIGDREKGPVSEWQKTLEDRMKGEASTQDVLAAFQKQYQSKLSGSPQAKEEKQKARAEDRARETAAPEEAGGAAAPEDTGRIKADPVSISNKFKELVQDSIKAKMPIDKNSLESMIQETIEIMEDDYDVDPEEARGAILRRFNNKMIDGSKIVFDPSSAPDTTAKKAPAQPGTAPEQAKPPASEQPQPEEQQAAGPTKPIEGRIKQDLGTEFKSQYDTFRKGLIDSERRKTPGAWDQNKERYIQPDEAQLRDLVDLSIDEIKGRHGNIDESSARSQLRQYLVDSLGIDPYEQEATPAPAEQGSAAPREEASAPAKQEASSRPQRPVTSKGGFRAPAQPRRKAGGGGFGGGTKPDSNTVKEITDAAKQAQSIEDFKTYLYNKQSNLFGKRGFESPNAPVETGSSPEPQASGTMPPEAEGAGKPGQQNLFKKGTLSPRTGKGFGSKPSAPAPTQPATSTGRADRMKELIDSGMTSAAALRQMEKEGTVAPRAAKGQGGKLRGPKPEAKPTPETPNAPEAKTKPSPRPLDQIAKAVLSGIERDKAARESAGQFFNRVRDLIAKQAGKGANVDQAAANAINQQKGRTTRNKTTNNAEYQEFAQSIRAMMR